MIDFKVIKRKILAELSGDEEKEFNRWINESEHNKAYFEKVKHYYKTTEVYNESVPDVNKIWEKIAVNLEDRRKSRVQHWIKVAASVAILLAIYITYQTNLQPVQTADSGLTIQPGTKGAVLVLSSGEEVQLGTEGGEIKEHDGTIINSDKGEVAYSDASNNGEGKDLFNEIRVGKGEEYNLILADGTKVNMNSMSVLRYPVKFNGKTREVTIEGEAYFDVTKNKEKPFVVHTHYGSVKVLGTAFNIRSYSNDQKGMFTLAEGSIELTSHNQKVQLVPGQQAIVDVEKKQVALKNVDVRLYTAWKDGRLMYRSEPLESITQDLERWYDINFEFVDKQVKDTEFSVFMSRHSDLNVVLDLLAATDKVSFTIKKRTVFISSK